MFSAGITKVRSRASTSVKTRAVGSADQGGRRVLRRPDPLDQEAAEIGCRIDVLETQIDDDVVRIVDRLKHLGARDAGRSRAGANFLNASSQTARSLISCSICRMGMCTVWTTFVGMTSTLLDSRVSTTLDRMFAEADAQMPKLGEMFGNDAVPAESSAQERADALSEFYLPVTPDAGRLLYALVRASRPTTVVEFGMSLGISAIHLASAVRDNGAGRVVTTELSADKVAAATRNFADAGLDDLITVLQGDALQTLAAVEGPVEFVLLDGWKDLYIQVLELLEPRLAPGALVVADNTSMPALQPYLDYVRDPANGYVSVSFPARDSDSMEISCRA